VIALILAGLVFIAVSLIVLLRPVPSHDQSGPDEDSAQLALLKRELRNLDETDTEESRQARVELQRRILREGRRCQVSLNEEQTQTGVLSLIIAAFVAVGVGTFVMVSRTDLSDQPLAERLDVAVFSAKGENELNQIVEKMENDLKKKSSTGETIFLLAESYRRLGRHDDSIEQFEKAAQSGYVPFKSFMAIAETAVARDEGRIGPEARQAFGRAAEIDGNHPRLQFYRGVVLAQDGAMKQAVALWKFLESDTNDKQLLKQIALNIDAIEKIMAGQSNTPTSPGPSAEDIAAGEEMTAGDRQSMIQGMVERLAAKMEEKPEDIDGWLRLSKAYQVLKDDEKAAGALKSLLKQDEGHALALFSLGEIRVRQGELDEARELWGKVLLQIPEDRPEHKAMLKKIQSLGE
jgi:cytochrome c-type biogenesis protein CcmH